MAKHELNQLVDQIRKLAANADQATRENLTQTLRHLSVELETPADTVSRVLYIALQPAICRVGNNLGIFEILSQKDAPITTTELAEKTKCDPVLMGRLLRFLASTDSITETDEDTFAANHVTKTLAKVGIRNGLNHTFDTAAPAFAALPTFLESTKYKNPDNSHVTPFQLGHKTDLSAFDWLQVNPKNLGFFLEWMPAQREGLGTWLDIFPIEQETKNVSSDRVLFVDVGGAVGHQCLELKTRYSSLPGRVIVEDRPEVVAAALPTKGVEALAHDFFTPQPIKSAKFYYLRNILHDWTDDKCRTILSHIRDAMASDSAVLIDEMVFPNKGAKLRGTQLDLVMMTSMAAMERTEKQFVALLDSVGLQLVQTYTYAEQLGDAILMCKKK